MQFVLIFQKCGKYSVLFELASLKKQTKRIHNEVYCDIISMVEDVGHYILKKVFYYALLL